jgi:glutamate synthase (ferredoxin)
MGMVALEELLPEDVETVLQLLKNHHEYTASAVAKRLLGDWSNLQKQFVKVMPVEYKKALEEMRKQGAAASK